MKKFSKVFNALLILGLTIGLSFPDSPLIVASESVQPEKVEHHSSTEANHHHERNIASGSHGGRVRVKVRVRSRHRRSHCGKCGGRIRVQKHVRKCGGCGSRFRVRARASFRRRGFRRRNFSLFVGFGGPRFGFGLAINRSVSRGPIGPGPGCFSGCGAPVPGPVFF